MRERKSEKEGEKRTTKKILRVRVVYASTSNSPNSLTVLYFALSVGSRAIPVIRKKIVC